ncbi:outer membrane chaperone Skp, partial [Marivirga lumbricoides]
FGFDGLFFLKKKELIKPVQDKVFEAAEIVAKKERLQIVFDKSGELIMIYTDPIHDYTDLVLEELGLIDDNDLNKN